MKLYPLFILHFFLTRRSILSDMPSAKKLPESIPKGFRELP